MEGLSEENSRRKGMIELWPLVRGGVCPHFSRQLFTPNARIIRRLRLSACGLTELHESVALLTELREVDISVNKLKTLPRIWAALPKLQCMRAFGNRFADPHLQHLTEATNVDWEADFESDRDPEGELVKYLVLLCLGTCLVSEWA